MDSATTDVTLKMKRFPLLFFACCPVTPKSAPCYFFREISLETLMESAFVDDFVVFWAFNFAIPPVFCPCYPGTEPAPGIVDNAAATEDYLVGPLAMSFNRAFRQK